MENTQTVFEEIRVAFADLQFLHEGQELKVTISIGIASTTQYTSAESINHAADEAMYVAKNTGRNRVEIDRTDEVV